VRSCWQIVNLQILVIAIHLVVRKFLVSFISLHNNLSHKVFKNPKNIHSFGVEGGWSSINTRITDPRTNIFINNFIIYDVPEVLNPIHPGFPKEYAQLHNSNRLSINNLILGSQEIHPTIVDTLTVAPSR
jgi:hypothetical protein